MSNVLITGANGTFGQLIVKRLLEEGHSVVASMREPKGKNSDVAQVLKKAGAYIVEMDVLEDDSVEEAITKTIAYVGTIDVLINNAGVGVHGIQEAFTPDDWRRIFDINVFAVQRVNRAVLPYMRERNSGLLMHVSSLIGRMTLPFWGVYGASKWALEAMAEGYRVELSDFGIDVCLVEPGPYATNFFKGLLDASDLERTKAYGDTSKIAEESFIEFGKILEENKEQNPKKVADTIALLINQPIGERNFRTIVDCMGMGEEVKKINLLQEEVVSTIYRNFGIEKMLRSII